ncbi:MAG: proprotein convertase P-domain-containing protein [Saprospiraceae bacterium]|nr:proprotein convertase P-domain-containing protein [Saprospiraceae bacterium]
MKSKASNENTLAVWVPVITHYTENKYCLPGIIALLAIFLATPLQAQRSCLTYEIEQTLQKDPEFFKRRQSLENKIQQFILNNQGNAANNTVTIPVVFHVVHNGDAVGTNENLAESLLLAQLDQLNADFSRMNSDANATPAAFQGAAANTMIQFCLATTDPNGDPTSGIIRHHLNLDQSACWNSSFIGSNIVSPNIWDHNKYLNIFTVNKITTSNCASNSILGYAYFPGSPANIDCAVHAYYTIGSLTNPNPQGGVYGYGRTVTHEVGHWLNLNHIWGSSGCGNDDGVNDTPPQDADNGGCPNFPLTDACTPNSPGVMYMNYMDYVNDQCMNMFTQGQASRMMAAISLYRQHFLTSECAQAAPQGYTCATAFEINSAGNYNAPGASEGAGAISGSNGTHANWYKFTPSNSGMINIYTCGLNGSGNNNLRVYHQNTGSCGLLDINDVIYQSDRGCSSGPNNPSNGVRVEDIPVFAGTPVYIEWDDALGNESPFSWTVEFQSAGSGGCIDYLATDVPQDIPDNPSPGLISTINVPSGGSISSVKIKNLDGTHTWMSDLKFTLTSPEGTSVILIDSKCADTDNFSISLNDGAANPIICPINDAATERPENALAAFYGENPMGNWTLTIEDQIPDDVGALNGWTLEICTSGGGDCPSTMNVNDNPIVSGTYQAGTQLTSLGAVGSSSSVLFRAGNNVELKPNFSVAPNSSFEIRIEGCQ